MATTLQEILERYEHEHASTHAVIAAMPDAHSSFRPHERSLDWAQLAWHVATTPLYYVSEVFNLPTKSGKGAIMAALKLNEQAKPFTLPGVDGKMHALSDYQDKEAVAVIFSCNHYPYVKAWEDRMVQIQGDYSPKGVHGGIGVQDSEAL